MKKMIQTTAIIAGLALMLGLTLTSCQKAATGPAGTNGTNGTNGVANIQTFTVATINATWTLDISNNSYTTAINASGVTSAVLDKGNVSVFIGDPTEWVALPASSGLVQYNYAYSLGQVSVSMQLSNGTVPGNPGGIDLKIVIIPPAMVKPNVNIKNYNEFKTAYNLID